MRYILPFALCITLLYHCTDTPPDPPVGETEAVTGEGRADGTSALPMPDPGIPGFTFPEDSNTVNGWLAAEDWSAIHRHAWGLWTGLTAVVNPDCQGNTLRAFETWATPADIVARLRDGTEPINMSCGRPHLNLPTQLVHTGNLTEGANATVLESVVYNPAAAAYALESRVFDRTALDEKIRDKQHVTFPDDALTAKPVWKIVPGDATAPYAIKTWSYPKDNQLPFPEAQWPEESLVDISGTAAGTPNTFPLSDFIHFRLTAQDTAYFNSEFFDGDQSKYKVGDYAILVAMHVATREIERWTWQTFWWSANPDAPQLPSSQSIADLRPEQLTGAPRHYALAPAYSMVWPAQPTYGGRSVGEPVYAFNPYLEAGFGPSTFSKPAIINPGAEQIVNNVGVRTNCMSCHIFANFDPAKPQGSFSVNYLADSYVSMGDPFFIGKLKADFAWSVTFNIYSDSTKTK